jgi:hypothetical protein
MFSIVKSLTTRIDAMLESDRVKRELIDFEEQMWEY